MAGLRGLQAYGQLEDDAKSGHVILQMPKGTAALIVHQFDTGTEASAALLELEKARPEDDIVLVGADSAAEIKSSFRNYFTDVGEFMDLIGTARAKLATGAPYRPAAAT